MNLPSSLPAYRGPSFPANSLSSWEKALRFIAALALPLSCALAAPLNETTAVQTRPEAAAPAITYLKAGTEPTPATDASLVPPPGWMAVEVPGPFEGFVLNRDLTKSLDVKPGSSLYLEPKLDAAVLTVIAKGDKATITGLHGKWTQIRLDKNLVGYIQNAGAAVAAAPIEAAPMTEAPAAPAGIGKAAPGYGSLPDNTLPRFFDGKFVSTHSLLSFHQPYDWQLVDENGSRRAYLDVSTLLQTDQLQLYTNHQVDVFGIVKALPNGKDLVIAVERLQLK